MGQFQWIKDKKDVRIKTKQECNRAKCYNSMEWRNLTRFYKMEHPLCELCLLENRINPVEHVHHLLKFNDQSNVYLQRTLLTDKDNIISLCYKCHAAIHMSPEDLTDKLREYVKKRKDDVFRKYLLLNTPITYTDDINVNKNKDK